MTARENERIVRQAHAAYGERDLDRTVASYAEDAERFQVATGDTYRGREGYRQ